MGPLEVYLTHSKLPNLASVDFSVFAATAAPGVLPITEVCCTLGFRSGLCCSQLRTCSKKDLCRRANPMVTQASKGSKKTEPPNNPLASPM